jgi:hypothetical protein
MSTPTGTSDQQAAPTTPDERDGAASFDLPALKARLTELAGEIEAIEKRLCDRGAEWYRENSGRSSFHPLELRWIGDTHVSFFTPIRCGEIEVDVPVEWFQ